MGHFLLPPLSRPNSIIHYRQGHLPCAFLEREVGRCRPNLALGQQSTASLTNSILCSSAYVGTTACATIPQRYSTSPKRRITRHYKGVSRGPSSRFCSRKRANNIEWEIAKNRSVWYQRYECWMQRISDHMLAALLHKARLVEY